MINPEDVSIPPAASAVHGISTELARQFGLQMPDVDSLFARLILQCDLVVAHNTPYDLDVTADNLPASSHALRTAQRATFDTMTASRDLVRAPLTEKQQFYFSSHPEKRDGDFKSPNLTETYRYFFGSSFDGAHDAMADIRACRDIFFELVGRGNVAIKGDHLETA